MAGWCPSSRRWRMRLTPARGKVLYWREAKVCLVQRQGEVVPKVGMTMDGPAEAGAPPEATGLRRWEFNAKTQVHCVGDGAPWIADQIEEQFGTQGTFPGRPVPRLRLSGSRQQGLRVGFRQGLAAIPEEAIDGGTGFRGDCRAEAPPRTRFRGGRAGAGARAWRYLSNRIDQLDYPRALALDLPVGSGAIESAHRYLVQARLKRPGAWWREDMAQAMLNLRVMRQNRLWEAYWEKRSDATPAHGGLKSENLSAQHFRSHLRLGGANESVRRRSQTAVFSRPKGHK
jgi:hypothetical protein